MRQFYPAPNLMNRLAEMNQTLMRVMKETKIDTAINAEDILTSLKSLKWTPGAGDFLPKRYGYGSRMTKYRKRKFEEELRQEVSKHLSIEAMFQRQRDLNLLLAQGAMDQATTVESEPESSLTETAVIPLDAATELKCLVDLPTEQTKEYGYILQKVETSIVVIP